MSIVVSLTRRGYRYTCNCDEPDILTPDDTGDDEYYCLHCGASRTIASCVAEARERKAAIRAKKEA